LEVAEITAFSAKEGIKPAVGLKLLSCSGTLLKEKKVSPNNKRVTFE
jgi:hypothetical protein